jgi:hypothetical protein
MDKAELQKRLKTFALRCYKLTSSLPQNSGGKYFQNQCVHLCRLTQIIGRHVLGNQGLLPLQN